MFIIFLFDSSMKICILNWVLSRQDIFNSLMNKNNPFEASTVVHNREQKSIILCSGRARFCITLDNTFKHLQHFFNVRAHKRDKMSLHTRVRLVIFGTLLSTTVVFNESVSTLLYLCIRLEMHILINYIVQ